MNFVKVKNGEEKYLVNLDLVTYIYLYSSGSSRLHLTPPSTYDNIYIDKESTDKIIRILGTESIL